MDQNGLIIEYTRQLADFTRLLVIATFILAAIALIVGLVQAIISRNAARRQLRAYVFVDNIVLFDSGQIRENLPVAELEAQRPVFRENEPSFHITIKNTGQTPAYHSTHISSIDVIEVRHEHAIIVPDRNRDAPDNYIAAGSQTVQGRWLGRSLSDQEKEDVRNGVRGIYAFGRIEYFDAFKKRRFTTYRLRYTGMYPPLPGVAFTYCRGGNEAN
jgi:hypothetical protein